jgi:hypothetical protein
MDEIRFLCWNRFYPSHYSMKIGVQMKNSLANRIEKLSQRSSAPSQEVEFSKTLTGIEAAPSHSKIYRREDFVNHTEMPIDTSNTPDLEQFGKAFGSVSPEAPNYNPICDFDSDGDVDGSDLAVFAQKYQ